MSTKMRSITEGLDKDNQPAANSKEGSPGLRDSVNELLSGPGGKIILAIIAIAMVAFLFGRLRGAVGPNPETVLEARTRMMNPLTGQLYWHRVGPDSETREGFYPVEYCWENHGDDLAVPVVLNRQLFGPGDPRRDEPTICPCGDEVVVPRNPKPEEYFGLTPKDYETDQAPECVVEHYQSVLVP